MLEHRTVYLLTFNKKVITKKENQEKLEFVE